MKFCDESTFKIEPQYPLQKLRLSWIKKTWIKIILKFIKTQSIDDLVTGRTLIFKEYKGIKYYIKQYQTPFVNVNCRCATFPITTKEHNGTT